MVRLADIGSRARSHIAGHPVDQRVFVAFALNRFIEHRLIACAESHQHQAVARSCGFADEVNGGLARPRHILAAHRTRYIENEDNRLVLDFLQLAHRLHRFAQFRVGNTRLLGTCGRCGGVLPPCRKRSE